VIALQPDFLVARFAVSRWLPHLGIDLVPLVALLHVRAFHCTACSWQGAQTRWAPCPACGAATSYGPRATLADLEAYLGLEPGRLDWQVGDEVLAPAHLEGAVVERVYVDHNGGHPLGELHVRMPDDHPMAGEVLVTGPEDCTRKGRTSATGSDLEAPGSFSDSVRRCETDEPR